MKSGGPTWGQPKFWGACPPPNQSVKLLVSHKKNHQYVLLFDSYLASRHAWQKSYVFCLR